VYSDPPIRDVAVELGLASQILRVTGTTEIDSPASLLCDEGLSLALSRPLAVGISIVRSLYNLPESFSAATQFVLDKDDQILCTDLAVQGKSLFRGAYLGSSGPVTWRRSLPTTPSRYLRERFNSRQRSGEVLGGGSRTIQSKTRSPSA
jgi:hypothetical protein